MTHALNWFEIPVTDMQRAKAFYAKVMQIELRDEEMDGMQMAIFPHSEDGVGGSLTAGPNYRPGPSGTIVYLNAGADIDGPLSRIEAAGGKIVMPKLHLSPEIGHIAIMQDSEGNHIGLHSPN